MSVVLPVRDGEATLGAALESLEAQTFPDFEAIVVDDGSQDGSGGIARAWERRDGRFRLVRMGGSSGAGGAVGSGGGGLGGVGGSAEDAAGTGRGIPNGIVAALQRGLAEARGTYIARMDADDRCHPERLAAQFDLLEGSPTLAGCGARVRYVPECTVTPRAAEYVAWLNSMTDWGTVAANIFVECPLAHPTFMFRARALAEAGGYRDRGWPEDHDLLLRLWRRGQRFVSVPRVLLDWGNDPGRLSRTHPAYSLAAFRACRVHHLRKSLLKGRSGVVVWGAGPTGKALSREFARQGVNVLAFIEVDPRKIGQRIHGAPVVGVEAVRARRGLAGRGGDAGGATAEARVARVTGAPEGAGVEVVPGVAAEGVRGAGGDAGALHVGAVARSAGREAVRGAVRGVGLGERVDFVAMA